MGKVAETFGKGIDLAEKAGDFIAPLIKGSLVQAIGIFEDKLKYTRWERQMRMMDRVQKIMEEQKITVNNPLPLKFALPLLQGASLEEDDDLQDLWINLLVNAVSSCNIEIKRVYMDILERISHQEAQIINSIYSISFEENQHKFLETYDLPNKIHINNGMINKEIEELKDEDIELSLINLAKQGCISPARTAGGGEYFSLINMTLLGKKFYDACTLKRDNVS